MTKAIWGLLGPEALNSERRTRTLGLGAAVRHFNDLAVPGIGGVWFGKQLMLATLGLLVAENARAFGFNAQNIETANAIEALACKLAFDSINWARDDRLRGNSKLRGKSDLSFKRLRQRGFYVSQPMRMATVQALPALCLAEGKGTRFNGFKCSTEGEEFVKAACEGFLPYKRSVVVHLVKWVCGQDEHVNSEQLCDAISPITTLPEMSRKMLRARLQEGAARRRNALEWMEAIRTSRGIETDWNVKPVSIEEGHWYDMQTGAQFFEVRDTAISVLDSLEAHIGEMQDRKRFALKDEIPNSVGNLVAALQLAAKAFLDVKDTNEEAKRFCSECVNADIVNVLKSLVERDGRVLRLVEQDVLPGPAFLGDVPTALESNDDFDSPEVANKIPLPEGISYRIRNLYLLNLDLHGELDAWLKPSTKKGDA